MIMRNIKHAQAVTALLLLSFTVFFPACAMFRGSKTASKILTPAGTKLEQAGNVEIPAHVETNQIRTEIPVKADTQISIVAATEKTPAHLVVTSPAIATVVQTQNLEVATAPKTVAPPTAHEEAEADGVRTFYWIAAGLAVLALAMGYAGHLKAAAFAAAGAIGIPFALHFLDKIAASFVSVAAICIAGSLFAAWYLIKNKPEVIAKLKEEYAKHPLA